MRSVKIYRYNTIVGTLSQLDDGSYTFVYTDLWFRDQSKPSVSLTLSKKMRQHHSAFLFPFFYNLLPEGRRRVAAIKAAGLRADDWLGLLAVVARYDVVGSIRVEPIKR